MIKIYHNPRCAKSREGLALLEASGKPYKTVHYLEETPDEEALRGILSKLGYAPIDLIRKNEAVWKEKFKGKDLTDDALVAAMVKYPKLIERPIVVAGKSAVVGRPPQKILELL